MMIKTRIQTAQSDFVIHPKVETVVNLVRYKTTFGPFFSTVIQLQNASEQPAAVYDYV